MYHITTEVMGQDPDLREQQCGLSTQWRQKTGMNTNGGSTVMEGRRRKLCQLDVDDLKLQALYR